MGIKYLTSYVNRNYNFKRVTLGPGSNVIIDGYSLCYRLYRGIEGSNYCQFHHAVTKYFQNILSHGINPIVVIDGIDFDNAKLETDIKRCEDKIEKLSAGPQALSQQDPVVPLMTKIVFIDALRDLKIPFFVSDGEADPDVVLLANHLNCYAVSSDSDFYIFSINKGYIPLLDERQSLISLTSEVRCFNYVSFSNSCGFSNPKVRLFLPYCLGNDFHGRNAIPQLGISVGEKSWDLVLKLRQARYVNYQVALSADSKVYELGSRSFADLSQSCVLREQNPSVPDWLLSCFKQGKILNTYMNMIANEDKVWRHSTVVEDVHQSSAWHITESVDRYIAGIIVPPEYILMRCHRRDLRICQCVVTRHDKHNSVLSPSSLATVDQMPLGERIHIMQRVFHCKSVAQTMKAVPDQFVLVVIATRFWLKIMLSSKYDTSPFKPMQFVVAFILCFQHCFSNQGSADVPGMPLVVKPMDKLLRHRFAQWECVMHCTIAFNQLLDSPFPYFSLGRLLNESVFNHYYQTNSQSHADGSQKTQYDVLFNTITRKLEE